ncbi:MAG: DUF2064 domain-containing protein, partial [Pseudomonadota bacterium]
HQVAALLRRTEDPRWQTVLAVAPDRGGMMHPWPAHLTRIPQGRGDLGARMGRIMQGVPPGPVCIIGADIPGVTRAHVARAFDALGHHDAVFGPAHDGGYWLVGLKRTGRVPRTLFKAVRWSTAYAMSDTMAGLPDARIALVDRLRDVDRAADLEALCKPV